MNGCALGTAHLCSSTNDAVTMLHPGTGLTSVSHKLLFMLQTYEEYLQVHGKTNEHSGCHSTSGGWTGNDAELTFPDDQIVLNGLGRYSNYLANWYRSQNPMMASNVYYGAQHLINTYPAIHHP
eukprot:Gb_31166 [translate_table: standard]